MAHDFVNAGNESINLAHVCNVKWDGEGGAVLGLSSGGAVQVTGEDADALAKKVGRHDAKHLTAKEAKADAKEEKAEAKAHGHK